MPYYQPNGGTVHVLSHCDADGAAAAAVVLQYYPDAQVVITNYHKPVHLNQYKAGDTLFVTDFSLKYEMFKEIERRNVRIIWIDHHESAINQLNAAGFECEGIRRTDYSGAMLTWLYFNKDKSPEQAPYFLKLVNWYDLWQHDKDPNVRPFQFGLGLWDTRPGYAPGKKFWGTLFEVGTGDKLLENAIKYGKIIENYVNQLHTLLCNDLAYKTSVRMMNGSTRSIIAMAIRPGNSQVFEKYEGASDSDGNMTYQYFGGNTRQYKCSIYSPPNTSKIILDIVQQYGGGGHPSAAGFNYPSIPVELPVITKPVPLEEAVAKYEKIYALRKSSSILLRFADRSNGITAKVCGWHTFIANIKCMAFNYYYLPEMLTTLPSSVDCIDQDDGEIPEVYVGFVLTNSGYYRCCAYPTGTSVDMTKVLDKLQSHYMKQITDDCYQLRKINDGIWWYAKEPPVNIPINLNASGSFNN